MILATDEVLTATLKGISATITVILATDEVISATLKDILSQPAIFTSSQKNSVILSHYSVFLFQVGLF